MGTLQDTLLQWYQEEVLLYTVVSLVAVLVVGAFCGFVADALTRLWGIGSERFTHRSDSRGKD
ncbi:MAG: hypothetical protein A2Y60_03445 [Chloroflexi bacterium RBG_13_54_9]|nr:MAG: hypothetical protein A2Y60_03445 [Chloroflexi bacterium RBG_13_54_9]